MTSYFAELEKKAQEENLWSLIAAIQLSEGDEHTVPNGLAIVKRNEWHPFEGRPYATVAWVVQPDTGAGFMSGHYDLSYEDAISDMSERIGVGV